MAKMESFTLLGFLVEDGRREVVRITFEVTEELRLNLQFRRALKNSSGQTLRTRRDRRVN